MPEPTAPREFTRVGVHLSVEIATAGSGTARGTSRDVSLRGIYVSTSDRVPTGTECRVSIRLEGSPAAPRIDCVGKVVRCDEGGIAVYFSGMGTTSFDHLRNLVLLNAVDPSSAERELRDHLGLKRRD